MKHNLCRLRKYFRQNAPAEFQLTTLGRKLETQGAVRPGMLTGATGGGGPRAALAGGSAVAACHR